MMTVTYDKGNDAWEIFTVVNGQAIRQVYWGYTKSQAIAKFKRMIRKVGK